jgi:hypothetical protein
MLRRPISVVGSELSERWRSRVRAELNPNAPTDARRLRAELEAQHGSVPRALARRICELADNGLDLFPLLDYSASFTLA